MSSPDMTALVGQYKDATSGFKCWLMSTYNLVTGHRIVDMTTYDGTLKPSLFYDMADVLAKSPWKAARPPNFAFEQLSKAVRLRSIASTHFRENVVNFSDDCTVVEAYEHHEYFLSVLKRVWEVLDGPEWQKARDNAAVNRQTAKHQTVCSDTESVATNDASEFDANLHSSAVSVSSHSEAGSVDDRTTGVSGSLVRTAEEAVQCTDDKPANETNKTKTRNRRKNNKNKKNGKKKKHLENVKSQMQRQQNADIEALFAQMTTSKPLPTPFDTQQELYVTAVYNLYSMIYGLHRAVLRNWMKSRKDYLFVTSPDCQDALRLIQKFKSLLLSHFHLPRGVKALVDHQVSCSTFPSPFASFHIRGMSMDQNRFFDMHTYNDLCELVDDYQHWNESGLNTGVDSKLASEMVEFTTKSMHHSLPKAVRLLKLRRTVAFGALSQAIAIHTHNVIAYKQALNHSSFFQVPVHQRSWNVIGPGIPHSHASMNYNITIGEITTWALQRQHHDFRALVRPHHVAFVRMLVDSLGAEWGVLPRERSGRLLEQT